MTPTPEPEDIPTLRQKVETDTLANAKKTAPDGDFLGDPSANADWPIIPGYALVGLIARSHSETVFVAKETEVDRDVAIRYWHEESTVERFRNEVRILACLSHPNIPPVYATGGVGSGWYVVTKHLLGRPFFRESCSYREREEELPRDLSMLVQVCEAVGFAHSQGIVHGNLQPNRIICGEFGEVYVTGWENARTINPSNHPDSWKTGAPLSDAPAFQSPEQVCGEALSPQTDVFTLGGLLAYRLTGRSVYSGTDSSIHLAAAAGDTAEIMPALDRCGADQGLIDLAKACLNGNPSIRPTDGRQVAAMLRAYLETGVVRLRQIERSRREAEKRLGETRRKYRRNLMLVLGLVAIVNFTMIAWWANRRTELQADESAGVPRRAAQLPAEKNATGVPLSSQANRPPPTFSRPQPETPRPERGPMPRVVDAGEPEVVVPKETKTKPTPKEIRLTALEDLAKAQEHLQEDRLEEARNEFERLYEIVPGECLTALTPKDALRLRLWRIAFIVHQRTAERAGNDPMKLPQFFHYEYSLSAMMAGEFRLQNSINEWMMERGLGQIRAFHVVRACTLSTMTKVDPDWNELADIECLNNKEAWWAAMLSAGRAHRNGQSEAAIKFAQAAVELDPVAEKSGISWGWKAVAQHKLGRHEEAQKSAEKLIEALKQFQLGYPAETLKKNKIHMHDWLEAEILLREYRTLAALEKWKLKAPSAPERK